jgi:hypothetical protein
MFKFLLTCVQMHLIFYLNTFIFAKRRIYVCSRLLLQLSGHQHRCNYLGGQNPSQKRAVFLLDAFHGNEPLADSVNQLLVVGFYLINVGYIALALKTEYPLNNLREVIELESGKIGVVLLILGGMHFFNMFVLAKMRRRSTNGMAVQVQ